MHTLFLIVGNCFASMGGDQIGSMNCTMTRLYLALSPLFLHKGVMISFTRS